MQTTYHTQELKSTVIENKLVSTAFSECTVLLLAESTLKLDSYNLTSVWCNTDVSTKEGKWQRQTSFTQSNQNTVSLTACVRHQCWRQAAVFVTVLERQHGGQTRYDITSQLLITSLKHEKRKPTRFNQLPATKVRISLILLLCFFWYKATNKVSRSPVVLH